MHPRFGEEFGGGSALDGDAQGAEAPRVHRQAVGGEGSCRHREASVAGLGFLDGPLQGLLLLVAFVQLFVGQHLSFGVSVSGLSNHCVIASVLQTS